MARRRSSGITSLRFNQDQGCFTCCLTSGLRVYNVDPLVEKAHYSADELGEVSLCEMVHRSNWLLVVRTRRPHTMIVLDDEKRQLRAEVTFRSPILALHARRDKVAVVLSTSIQVLSLPGLQRVALIRTPAGARPLCAITAATTAPTHLLAAPAHRVGSLQLLDVTTASIRGTQSSSSPAVLACHRGALACISLSASGARLATASARGTLVRIWDTGARVMLNELRRGADHADVYCINFNPSATLVCCVSDKGTLHVWRGGRGGGAGTRIATAHAPPDTRAIAAFRDDTSAVGTYPIATQEAGNALMTPLGLQMSIGGDDHLLSGSSYVHFPHENAMKKYG
ncbi:WD repeat domain phosphoinositide-interacting protein 4 [Eumeta japonica]|uniref:WD repeat domain phosphoinositide-interacting protein 4 n=1 Tax=Eumeta variegata TaxID=151549 RepID=A0A4C1WJD2_EUMVA|nr:WD repeat domain phosphoinositide-interacting protein 4 [Eumeta japonica]